MVVIGIVYSVYNMYGRMGILHSTFTTQYFILFLININHRYIKYIFN